MTLAGRADAAVTRDAQAAAARIRRSDLIIAAAHLDVHGKPHLRPVADRLAGLAAALASEQPETTPDTIRGAQDAPEDESETNDD